MGTSLQAPIGTHRESNLLHQGDTHLRVHFISRQLRGGLSFYQQTDGMHEELSGKEPRTARIMPQEEAGSQEENI